MLRHNSREGMEISAVTASIGRSNVKVFMINNVKPLWRYEIDEHGLYHMAIIGYAADLDAVGFVQI